MGLCRRATDMAVLILATCRYSRLNWPFLAWLCLHPHADSCRGSSLSVANCLQYHPQACYCTDQLSLLTYSGRHRVTWSWTKPLKLWCAEQRLLHLFSELKFPPYRRRMTFETYCVAHCFWTSAIFRSGLPEWERGFVLVENPHLRSLQYRLGLALPLT